jgi:hypothetical protein
MNPEYVNEITDTEVVMRNFEGDEYRYPLVDEGRTVNGSQNGAEVRPDWLPDEVLV